MEESFSRAGETKPGGFEVILCRPSRCRSSAHADEIPSQKDRFSRLKNSSYTAATRIVMGCGNGCKNGASVTTKHLLSPNQRRRAAWSIPNSLRNPILSATRQPLTPGGVEPGKRRQNPRPKTAHGIFCLMASLLPVLKKCAATICANSKRPNLCRRIVGLTTFHEHQSLC